MKEPSPEAIIGASISAAIEQDVRHLFALEEASFEGRLILIDDKIHFANQNATQLLARETASLINRTIWDFVDRPAESRFDSRSVLADYHMARTSVHLRDGSTRRVELRHRGVQGPGFALGIVALRPVAEMPLVEADAETDAIGSDKPISEDNLAQKDAAVKELVWQLRDVKRSTLSDITLQVERLVLPLLLQLQQTATPGQQETIRLVSSAISDILSDESEETARMFKRLTPRESQICHMIRQGLASKDIASQLNTSVQTVLAQRKQIRRKLGISGRSVNLSSYLLQLEDEEE